jgi:hypothetical protein
LSELHPIEAPKSTLRLKHCSTTSNRFSTLETQKDPIIKRSIFQDSLMPIKDQSTLATMEFNSNSKVTKMEKIDSLLMSHPKRGFLEN